MKATTISLGPHAHKVILPESLTSTTATTTASTTAIIAFRVDGPLTFPTVAPAVYYWYFGIEGLGWDCLRVQGCIQNCNRLDVSYGLISKNKSACRFILLTFGLSNRHIRCI